jgi:acyl carrier protein
MPISDKDLASFAARIRPHFEPELRDAAEELALRIAYLAGARVKLLRPETTVRELREWCDFEEAPVVETGSLGSDSLDTVELVMALEEELGPANPHELASTCDTETFRDLVVRNAKRRRAA